MAVYMPEHAHTLNIYICAQLLCNLVLFRTHATHTICWSRYIWRRVMTTIVCICLLRRLTLGCAHRGATLICLKMRVPTNGCRSYAGVELQQCVCVCAAHNFVNNTWKTTWRMSNNRESLPL